MQTFWNILLKYEGKDDNWTVVTEGKVREQAREIAKRAKRPPAKAEPQQ